MDEINPKETLVEKLVNLRNLFKEYLIFWPQINYWSKKFAQGQFSFYVCRKFATDYETGGKNNQAKVWVENKRMLTIIRLRED